MALIVSAFGQALLPVTTKQSASALAATHSAYITLNQLDGVVIENFDEYGYATSSKETPEWYKNYIVEIRKTMPLGCYLVSIMAYEKHFSYEGSQYKMRYLYTLTKDKVDNVFINYFGGKAYSTEEAMMKKAPGKALNSYAEITATDGIDKRIPLDVLIMGKHPDGAVAGPSYVSPVEFGKWISKLSYDNGYLVYDIKYDIDT